MKFAVFFKKTPLFVKMTKKILDKTQKFHHFIIEIGIDLC